MDLSNKFDTKVVGLAIENGIKYLLSRNINDRWKGFPTLAGESDIWVTGFVLAHINNLCKKENVIKESQNFLLQSRHPSGGWSYSAQVPPDADSTACCLMALQDCKEFAKTDLKKARIFLWKNFTNSGVSTYTTESGIREFISAPDNETIAGWTSAHPDVSIASVLADIESEKAQGILNWLLSQQINFGFINSYWWRSPYYTSTLLLRALIKLKLILPKDYAEKFAQALVGEQLSDGGFSLDSSKNTDSFTTALALESFAHLSYLDFHRERTNCGNALMLLQNKNGAWDGGFILRIPAPFVTDPNQVTSWSNVAGGGNTFIEDKEGIFATAMACYALHCWRQIELQKDSSEEWPVFQLTKTNAL